MTSKKRKGKFLFYQADGSGEVMILLGRRISKGEEFWWLPGGSAEKGESFFAGAVREMYEEMEPGMAMESAVLNFLKKAKEPEYLEYETDISLNKVFLVKIKESLPSVPEIKEEFEELKWFSINELPRNMSREFQYIKDKVFIGMLK